MTADRARRRNGREEVQRVEVVEGTGRELEGGGDPTVLDSHQSSAGPKGGLCLLTSFLYDQ